MNDRSINMKLVIEASSGNINQEFYIYITEWSGKNEECYGDHFLYQSRTDMALHIGEHNNCSFV